MTGPNHDAAMQEALALARKAEEQGEVPVGAVVIAPDGRVIGRGYNRRETDNDPLAHAEVMAIREATRELGSWRLNDCTLVVTLEPCPMCLAACQQSRLAQVVYGARDPKGGAISLEYALHQDKRLNHRFEAVYSETPECGGILTRFFRRKRDGSGAAKPEQKG